MMEHELNQIWKSSQNEELVVFEREKLLIGLRSELDSFNEGISKRDTLEILAAIIVICMFGTASFFFEGIIAKIGLWTVTLYGFLVIFTLKYVKKHKIDYYSLPIKEFLTKYRTYIIKEKNLLDNILYWYLLPPTIGSILFFIGTERNMVMLALATSFVLALNFYIFKLNKRSVKNDFEPLIKNLDIVISSMEEKSSS